MISYSRGLKPIQRPFIVMTVIASFFPQHTRTEEMIVSSGGGRERRRKVVQTRSEAQQQNLMARI